MDERDAELDQNGDSPRSWRRVYAAVILWTLLTIAAIGLFSTWSF